MRIDNHEVYRRECNNDAALSARDRDCGMYYCPVSVCTSEHHTHFQLVWCVLNQVATATSLDVLWNFGQKHIQQ